MTQPFELNAEIRTTRGKAENRRMRHNDMIPAIIYGAGQAPEPITLRHKDIAHALENEAVFSHILTLNVGKKSQKVVLKAVERHAYKPKIMHVDFLRIKAKEKITMQIPVHFIGEETAAGIKQGGMLSKLMTEVEIHCLPGDLPEFFEADITELELDSTLHLSDITLPANVELTTAITDEHNPPVANIHKPKAATEEEVAPDTDATDDGSAADAAEEGE